MFRPGSASPQKLLYLTFSVIQKRVYQVRPITAQTTPVRVLHTTLMRSLTLSHLLTFPWRAPTLGNTRWLSFLFGPSFKSLLLFSGCSLTVSLMLETMKLLSPCWAISSVPCLTSPFTTSVPTNSRQFLVSLYSLISLNVLSRKWPSTKRNHRKLMKFLWNQLSLI